MDSLIPLNIGDSVYIRLRGVQVLPYFPRGKQDGGLEFDSLRFHKFTFPKDHDSRAIIEDVFSVRHEGVISIVWPKHQRVLLHPFYYCMFWEGYYIVVAHSEVAPRWRARVWIGRHLLYFLNKHILRW